MVRSRILALSLVSLCSMQIAQANVLKDTTRVVGGCAAGAAGYAALGVVYNTTKTFVWEYDKLGKDTIFAVDARLTRLFGLVGGAIGLATTTYARTLRAQWNLWFWSSKHLIAITMADYETEAQLVDVLQRYYLTSAYPLVTAKLELASKLDCLTRAAELIEAALEDIDEDSSRADELNDWLEEIYTVRAYVARAATAVEKDPRLAAMIDAQNRIDQTNALWADAAGHIAVAFVNGRK